MVTTAILSFNSCTEEEVDCTDVTIVFVASMDGAGSILIANPLGVSGYEYSLNDSPFQVSQVFNGPYVPGNFLIKVKDRNGCVVTETRYIDNNIDSLSLLEKLIQWGPWLSDTIPDGTYATLSCNQTQMSFIAYDSDGSVGDDWGSPFPYSVTGNNVFRGLDLHFSVVSISESEMIINMPNGGAQGVIFRPN